MFNELERIASIAMIGLVFPGSGAAQVATPDVLGRWQGLATITVNWTRQRTLPVDITIFAGDTVSGTVGDASLSGARLERNDGPTPVAPRWKSDYAIRATLAGPVIRAENIWRPTVTIALSARGDGLEGGVSTSGWKVVNIEYRVIDAKVVLHRVPDPDRAQ